MRNDFNYYETQYIGPKITLARKNSELRVKVEATPCKQHPGKFARKIYSQPEWIFFYFA